MSTVEEVFNYVNETPQNTNPSVLMSMLNGLSINYPKDYILANDYLRQGLLLQIPWDKIRNVFETPIFILLDPQSKIGVYFTLGSLKYQYDSKTKEYTLTEAHYMATTKVQNFGGYVQIWKLVVNIKSNGECQKNGPYVSASSLELKTINN